MLNRVTGLFRRRQRRTYDVLFVCSAEIDEIWIRSTAIACHRCGLTTSVVICDQEGKRRDELQALYDAAGASFCAFAPFADAADLTSQIVVTASSGLNRGVLPTRARYFVHMPHSLASLHVIYPADAFDGYDALFASGPHHTREFEALSMQRELGDRPVFPVGYGKLDLLLRALEDHVPDRSEGDSRHVLLAPSWGPDNLLDRLGPALVESLANKGYRVTIRPHPLFFLDDSPVLRTLTALTERLDACTLESPLVEDRAILDADLLIGDYSGTSFEFAALRRKPVLSVDVGLKEVNPDWRQLCHEPVEIALREHIGAVAPPDIDAIIQSVESLLSEPDIDDNTISAFLYAPETRCADGATAAIKALLNASQQV